MLPVFEQLQGVVFARLLLRDCPIGLITKRRWNSSLHFRRRKFWKSAPQWR
jgi:hypothetical protein